MHPIIEIKTAEPLPQDEANAIVQFLVIFASLLSQFDDIQKRLTIIHKPLYAGFGLIFSFGRKHTAPTNLISLTEQLIKFERFKYQSNPAEYGVVDIVANEVLSKFAANLRDRDLGMDLDNKTQEFVYWLGGVKSAQSV